MELIMAPVNAKNRLRRITAYSMNKSVQLNSATL
jgi:hypothetical protein